MTFGYSEGGMVKQKKEGRRKEGKKEGRNERRR